MLNRLMEKLVDGIRLRLVGPTLLQDIELLDLGTTIDDATRLYGKHVETKQNEDLPESECYSFEPSEYHGIDVWIWKSAVHAIVYFSAKGEPEMDLTTIREKYGGKQHWDTINEGFTYRRADQQVRLWCSAMPAIGVGSEEYMRAEAEQKSRTSA
jgi:hypothetical protein